jgi:hypothetical protein
MQNQFRLKIDLERDFAAAVYQREIPPIQIGTEYELTLE